MLSDKEIAAVRKRLQALENLDIEKRSREAKQAAYAKTSANKIRKGSSKAKKQDVYSKGKRLSGSGYSKSYRADNLFGMPDLSCIR